VWEKGPVRCGHLTRADGVQVPMYHDSEVAAIAFMLQQMLIRRGFLEPYGGQVSAERLDRLLAQRAAVPVAPAGAAAPVRAAAATGAKCPECGARALHKIDGCTRCTACHYLGGCA
jgi:ribonucleoside-diphosphate reductase alpha chain